MIPAWMIDELEELRREQQEQEAQYEQLQLPVYDYEPPARPTPPNGTILKNESCSRVIVIEL